MKKLLLIIIGLFGIIGFPIFAQEQTHNSPGCENRIYDIKGLSDIKKGQTAEYNMIRAKDKYLGPISLKSVNFTLTKNNKTIQKSNTDLLGFTPTELGKYTLQVESVDNENCYNKITKDINVHEKIILYLGKESNDLQPEFDENFQKYDTLFKKIIIKEKKLFGEDELFGQISENIPYIKNSSTIIINTNNFDSLFQTLGNINKTDTLNLNKKDIYLITDLNKHFLKRILAKYMNIILIEKIYTVNDKDFFSIISKLSFNKDLQEDQIITTFSLSFQETPKYVLISYLIDNLIYNGFPVDLIGILLILCIATLVISIFRQVIGFSVFGIYSPLLFGLTMAILNVKLSLFLLAIGILAKLLTNILNKKIYLLFNAKLSVLVVLYFLLIIIVLGLDKILNTNIINLDIFNNGFIIFPIMFIIIVTDKVFNEGFKLFSIGWWISFAEFLIVSFSVFGLLNRGWMKHILLSYPESIILVLVMHIFVGRFTGLQLLEYFRFMPLIKKHFDGEEE
ncbi:MAG: 7TM domain-containing protein [Candidatus Absconditabacteria bacterium]|nr:7TM domain-containing protein [Candidatus Absconditabacteria bacterium]